MFIYVEIKLHETEPEGLTPTQSTANYIAELKYEQYHLMKGIIYIILYINEIRDDIIISDDLVIILANKINK